MSVTIALLTDFGTKDIYVGVMKGVMRGICPDAHLIDLTHEIMPQNVQQAAFVLMNAYHYFPEGTVFLIVVDPGVGSARKPIAVRAGGYTFIAPDNGVLTYVLQHLRESFDAVALINPAYHRDAISKTFHGRDIFAPSAAHLASGVSFEAMGELLDDIVRFETPRLNITDELISAEIVHIDHFGNSVSSIGQFEWLDESSLRLHPMWGGDAIQISADVVTVQIGEHQFSGIHRTYSDAPAGEMLVLIGSEGYLEVAANQGNAAQQLNISVGDALTLTRQ